MNFKKWRLRWVFVGLPDGLRRNTERANFIVGAAKNTTLAPELQLSAVFLNQAICDASLHRTPLDYSLSERIGLAFDIGALAHEIVTHCTRFG